ncbi:glycosyltransferase family 39 protein [uncultured Algimonas sp.]|uniref:ArnT family glycosyltransferase n=1 Tax=uncultured Algimonas sp. TaxID=1547920 RepID=UPI00262BD647|nr:glycosyltransferase family 39 protein [uncultured Algimonas sp.]
MTQTRAHRWLDLAFLALIALVAYLPGLAALPPVDRDEARYMQATVQMAETGDLIDIRFQDEARYKKPAGAYWAQLASLTATGQLDDVRRGERAAWAHRLPSVIGALIAVWATYLTGAALFGRREALLGAGWIAVSVSLAFEAHIAKTDALLAGAAAVALYGIAARKAWQTWFAIAVGTLIKGPILLGVGGLALLTDALWTRSAKRLRALARPLPILVALGITLPWFIAIGIETDGAFFAEALGRDLGGKIAGAQETHGGTPGYYALTTLAMFWPGVLALPVAAMFAWRERRNATVRLLVAWTLPMWVLLEFVPTKLPHYTLPLYPALALLAGAGWVRLTEAGRTRIAGLAVAAFVAALLSVGTGAAIWERAGPVLSVSVAASLTALSVAALWFVRQARDRVALALAALFVGLGFTALSRSPLLDLTPRLVAQSPAGARIVSPDYREPSLVFMAGTDTQLTRGARPGDVLVLASGTPPPACAGAGESVSGTNYAKGRQMTLTMFDTTECSAAALTEWAYSSPTQRRPDQASRDRPGDQWSE